MRSESSELEISLEGKRFNAKEGYLSRGEDNTNFTTGFNI